MSFQLYVETGRKLRLEPAAIEALVKAEGGDKSGFLADGRVRILYEPHIFSRLTRHRFDGSHPLISYPKWGQRAYGTFTQQWDKLEAARKVDDAAALKACSWGRFQVLGENFALAGHESVYTFVEAMKTEAGQVEAFIAFACNVKGLLDALRQKDWKTVAFLYNGKAYDKPPGRENDYDVKLERHYAEATSPKEILA